MQASYKDPLLKQAFKLYRQRKYQSIINLLESHIYKYRESKICYDILGLACLFTQEYAAALSYFTRGLELAEDNADSLYCIGLIHYIRGRTRDALGYLLQALTYKEKHRLSKRLLAYIRKDKSMGRGNEAYCRVSRVPKFVPRGKTGLVVGLGAFAFSAIAVGIGVLLYGSVDSNRDAVFALPRNFLMDAPQLTKDEQVQPGSYQKTDQEVRAAFRAMESLFLEKRDPEVRLIANELLLSNISFEVRTKVEQILELLNPRPSFFDKIPEIDFADVSANPALYNAVAVSWKGKVANLRADEEVISFDFLVGYIDQNVLTGIARVEARFPIVLENEMSVEVLALIVPEDTEFFLDAISIRTHIE